MLKMVKVTGFLKISSCTDYGFGSPSQYLQHTAIFFFIRKIALGGLLQACLFVSSILQVNAQCTQQVTHLSGTQQVGCTNVTVTSAGSVTTATFCGIGPYVAGSEATGSYTFTFSPPIDSFSFSVGALDNHTSIPTFNALEELLVFVNGSFFPLTTANLGGPSGCSELAVLHPTGTLRADSILIYGDMANLKISISPINSLTFECVQLGPSTAVGAALTLQIPCCNCTTDAGSITAQGLTNYCTNETVNISHNGNQVLDGNDILRYVLFSNPSDTAGSEVATSSTPNFTFASPMQTGVTYYVAAVAGNDLNGTVDLTDPCLDFSNANALVWRPLPTVAFSVANPNVCAGACTTVTATFTGTAPFTLTYTTPASGTVMQTFSGNAGTFQVCSLPGAPPGSWVVQATKVVDAWCTCE